MDVIEKASTMKVTRLKEHIGAEVTGIDLREPVDAATRLKEQG
jgi:alpha-ketoglutarate-dependent taurine dioxygenase